MDRFKGAPHYFNMRKDVVSALILLLALFFVFQIKLLS